MNLVAFIIVVATLSLAYGAGRSWSVRHRALRRLYDDMQVAAVIEPSLPEGWLAPWLSRAGYRAPNAPALFIATTAGAVGVGIVAGWFYNAYLMTQLVQMVASVPGGAGDALTAILRMGPWILVVAAGFAPTLVVRAARRARVR